MKIKLGMDKEIMLGMIFNDIRRSGDNCEVYMNGNWTIHSRNWDIEELDRFISSFIFVDGETEEHDFNGLFYNYYFIDNKIEAILKDIDYNQLNFDDFFFTYGIKYIREVK